MTPNATIHALHPDGAGAPQAAPPPPAAAPAPASALPRTEYPRIAEVLDRIRNVSAGAHVAPSVAPDMVVAQAAAPSPAPVVAPPVLQDGPVSQADAVRVVAAAV